MKEDGIPKGNVKCDIVLAMKWSWELKSLGWGNIDCSWSWIRLVGKFISICIRFSIRLEVAVLKDFNLYFDFHTHFIFHFSLYVKIFIGFHFCTKGMKNFSLLIPTIEMTNGRLLNMCFLTIKWNFDSYQSRNWFGY